MTTTRLLGIVGFAIGAILLVVAYHASNAPMERFSNALTGRFTDHTMWYVILGAAAAVGGASLLAFGKRA
jgi:hypothetical protein